MTRDTCVADFAVFAEAFSQLLFIHTRRQAANEQLLTTAFSSSGLQTPAQ